MKVLRKRDAPHIELHIDGETRTILHACTKCKMITKYTGPEAF